MPTNFVRLTNGALVRAEAIHTVRGWNKDGTRPLYGADDRHLGNATDDELGEGTGVIVPAAAGWRVCVMNVIDDPVTDHSFEDVIAWRIDGLLSCVTPITLLGDWQNNKHLLVSPHGAASDYEGSWDTLDEALAYIRKSEAKAA